MKGAARLLSADAICEKALVLESAGRAGDLENAHQQLRDLEAEIRVCLEALPKAVEQVCYLAQNQGKT
ncbi:MAG: hypothetical protein U0136_06255 [Bdellovibrionota bacterium]